MSRAAPILLLLLAVLAAAQFSTFAAQATPQDNRAPSEADLKALMARVLANQHTDDQAIAFYERIEHRTMRDHINIPAPIEDKVLRVVPTGTGNVSIELEDHGRAIDAAIYRREMVDLEKALEASADPTNLRAQQDRERFLQRTHERAEVVNAVLTAYHYTWAGNEEHNGRTLVKLHMEPDPAYRPSSRYTEFLRHGIATIWVDEQAGQVARIEAELTSDVSFVGGVFAKVYRGGRMVLEQREIEPGIWLPVYYQYDFTGRKFLFLFEVHEKREITNYKRIGPPEEALATIRHELSATKPPVQ